MLDNVGRLHVDSDIPPLIWTPDFLSGLEIRVSSELSGGGPLIGQVSWVMVCATEWSDHVRTRLR